MEKQGCSTLGEQCRLGKAVAICSPRPVIAGSGIRHLDMAEDSAKPWHVCTAMSLVDMRGPLDHLSLPTHLDPMEAEALSSMLVPY